MLTRMRCLVSGAAFAHRLVVGASTGRTAHGAERPLVQGVAEAAVAGVAGSLNPAGVPVSPRPAGLRFTNTRTAHARLESPAPGPRDDAPADRPAPAMGGSDHAGPVHRPLPGRPTTVTTTATTKAIDTTTNAVRTLLLSLRPQFADAILSGTKTVELRRRPINAQSGTPILLYASRPTMAIRASRSKHQFVTYNDHVAGVQVAPPT
jgi:hypothetical protein